MKQFLKVIFLPFNLIFSFFYKIKIKSFFRNVSIEKIDALKGLEFEEIVALIFKYSGYNVTKTKASNDYGVDVLVKKRGVVIAIQTKLYYGHNVGNSAVQEIHSGLKYYNADFGTVITNWNFSAQAKNLAQALSVVLINRQVIIDFLHCIKSGTKETFFSGFYKNFKIEPINLNK